MGIEVVVPSVRQEGPERLVRSLSRGSVKPDLVTIVSNETQPFDPSGLRVRLIRFESDDYHIGDSDVALRQNVGLFEAVADHVVIQGDDQIAPFSMVEDCIDMFTVFPYFWGNHRLIDFSKYTMEEIQQLPPYAGESREDPVPPARHQHFSCYGGMFGSRTDLVQEIGGMDMALNCHHGNEDQQLGYRLMRREKESTVVICEPPYSWHGIELKHGDGRATSPYLPTTQNGCTNHEIELTSINGHSFVVCIHCPHKVLADTNVFEDDVIIRYQPNLVRATSVWL